MLRIEYDPAKDRINLAKHGLQLTDVVLLNWDQALVRLDERKAYGERRYTALVSGDTDLFQVAFTIRGDVMRIISFRRAHDRERKRYE